MQVAALSAIFFATIQAIQAARTGDFEFYGERKTLVPVI
jgi:hypothetical protein